LDNWNKIEFIFAHKLHISPIDLQQLEFYRIQYILKEFEEYVKKENDEYEKQQKEAERKSKTSSSSVNYGGFKVPKFDVPKFDIPKY
jgi:hypothetical protein